jgi:hypothetical protein
MVPILFTLLCSVVAVVLLLKARVPVTKAKRMPSFLVLRTRAKDRLTIN